MTEEDKIERKDDEPETDSISLSTFSSLSVKKTHVCPVCGEQYNIEINEGITISIQPYQGNYCLKCYAKWISENFPRLLLIREEKND